MKIRKIVFILAMVMIIVTLLNIKVFAADSFSATLTPDNQRVPKGETVTVTLKLSSINVQNGISVFGGTLKYDSDVLSIENPDNDIKGLNGWVVTYNKDNSKLTIDSSSAVSADTEIATFKFKVNSTTSATTAAVQLVSITAGNATIDETVSISDITANISIGNGSLSPVPTTSSTPSTTPTTTPTMTQNAVSTSPTETPKTTKTEEDMPNTGAENYILPLMLVIAGLAVVSFIGYKKIDTK